MRGRAFERITRGLLAVACAVNTGCALGTITIVAPSNGGFTDPIGNVTAQISRTPQEPKVSTSRSRRDRD